MGSMWVQGESVRTNKKLIGSDVLMGQSCKGAKIDVP